MAGRDIQVARTRKSLEEAFKRLKNGTVINVFGSYKISPSKVEQEAAVAQGTLNNRHYKELKSEIIAYKAAVDAKEKGFSSEADALRVKLKEAQQELSKSLDQRKVLGAKLKHIEQLLIQQAAEHLMIVEALIKEIPESKRLRINYLIEGARKEKDIGNNIINFRDHASNKNRDT
jgi:hypothetical protein